MKQRYSKSSGYVLVFFTLILGVLVSIAGVAVDIGNLYIIRNRLERAAKAGALAGVGYRSLRGWGYFATYVAGTPTLKSTKDELFGVMSGVVTENMRAAFSAPTEASEFTSNLTVTSTNFYDPMTDTFTINAKYQAPTFIIGRLGAALGAATCPEEKKNGIGTGKYRCPITVTETARLERAVVALLLDVSGSMNCKASDLTNCACRTDTTGNGCGTSGRVIDALV
ncbi:MAG: Tad domain-containing protein, partial [Proteobacteria bacterium]|nr:Tad domain-containing protein [Pseudomonadota bacterium]